MYKTYFYTLFSPKVSGLYNIGIWHPFAFPFIISSSTIFLSPFYNTSSQISQQFVFPRAILNHMPSQHNISKHWGKHLLPVHAFLLAESMRQDSFANKDHCVIPNQINYDLCHLKIFEELFKDFIWYSVSDRIPNKICDGIFEELRIQSEQFIIFLIFFIWRDITNGIRDNQLKGPVKIYYSIIIFSFFLYILLRDRKVGGWGVVEYLTLKVDLTLWKNGMGVNFLFLLHGVWLFSPKLLLTGLSTRSLMYSDQNAKSRCLYSCFTSMCQSASRKV